MAEQRSPGIHPFDEVVDDRLGRTPGSTASVERSAARLLAVAGGA
jgi:hypothetical protein